MNTVTRPNVDMPAGIALRPASVEDARTIAQHRRAMFRDMGYKDESALDSMTAKFLLWLEAKIAAGD